MLTNYSAADTDHGIPYYSDVGATNEARLWTLTFRLWPVAVVCIPALGRTSMPEGLRLYFSESPATSGDVTTKFFVESQFRRQDLPPGSGVAAARRSSHRKLARACRSKRAFFARVPWSSSHKQICQLPVSATSIYFYLQQQRPITRMGG